LKYRRKIALTWVGGAVKAGVGGESGATYAKIQGLQHGREMARNLEEPNLVGLQQILSPLVGGALVHQKAGPPTLEMLDAPDAIDLGRGRQGSAAAGRSKRAEAVRGLGSGCRRRGPYLGNEDISDPLDEDVSPAPSALGAPQDPLLGVNELWDYPQEYLGQHEQPGGKRGMIVR
jgi:hypothetical protein